MHMCHESIDLVPYKFLPKSTLLANTHKDLPRDSRERSSEFYITCDMIQMRGGGESFIYKYMSNHSRRSLLNLTLRSHLPIYQLLHLLQEYTFTILAAPRVL